MYERNGKTKKNIPGKSTENEVATGSSICLKDSLSPSAKFSLLSANSAFVFFIGLVSFYLSLSKDFSLFFNLFHDLNKAK